MKLLEFWQRLFRRSTSGAVAAQAAAAPNTSSISTAWKPGQNAAASPASTPLPPELGFLMQKFMTTPGLAEKKAMLQAHPELLGREIDAMLVRSCTDARTTDVLGRFRILLELCRQIGVEAAFEEIERRQQEPPIDPAISHHLIKVLATDTIAEMEAVIRADPRVIAQRVRQDFRVFVALHGDYGLPPYKIQTGLGILERCERDGIDATFEQMRKAAAEALPRATEAFNRLIEQFKAGGDAVEIACEATRLFTHLAPIPRRACLVLALVASGRAGNQLFPLARRLALQLNKEASGWDLPFMPSRAILPTVMLEDQDVGPILEALENLTRQGEGSAEEQAAIRSLADQYALRKAPAKPTSTAENG